MKSKPTILLVDDSPTAMDAIEAALADVGAALRRARSGEAALRESLDCDDLAVVVLDVNMPGMGGFEVAELLRRRPRFATTPVIFMTGVAMEQHQIFHGYELGAVDYIFKPVDPHILRSKVSVFVELRRQRTELQRLNDALEERVAERTAEQRRTVNALRALHELTTGPAPFPEKVTALLSMGSTHFGLPTAIVSRIEDDRYEVVHAVSSEGAIEEGATFPLGDAACGETLKHGGPLHLHDIAESRRRTHPCSGASHLGAYAGVPIVVGDGVIGTLNFFGPEGRVPFSGSDDALLELMGRWLGSELWRRETEEALRASERQFLHAQRLETVGRLASGGAHDYNNLLMGISGCIQIALKYIDPETRPHRYLDEARRAAMRGSSLTRQLLAFSHREEAVPTEVDLNTVLQSTERLVRSLVGETVEVRFALKVGDGRVRADAGQLEQVLMNLVVNARDAMRGHGALEVEAAEVMVEGDREGRPARLSPGAYVTLRVTDTGCGMDEATRARAFEPFFTTKGVGGTGLGLATVKDIIEESGGVIDLVSEIGRGTTVTVYLPCSEAEASSKRRPTAIAPGPTSTRTVLVVEDEPLVRLALRGYLEEAGYRVLEACDAVEAELMGREHGDAIHVLLTDIMLPGSSGPTVAAGVSELSPGVRVIFMSAHPKSALVEAGHLDASAAVLRKPFDEETLVAEIERARDE